ECEQPPAVVQGKIGQHDGVHSYTNFDRRRGALGLHRFIRAATHSRASADDDTPLSRRAYFAEAFAACCCSRLDFASSAMPANEPSTPVASTGMSRIFGFGARSIAFSASTYLVATK